MWYLSHSAKGTTWKNHKYIRIENGRYIYKEKESKGSLRDKAAEAEEWNKDKLTRANTKSNMTKSKPYTSVSTSARYKSPSSSISTSNRSINRPTNSALKTNTSAYAKKSATSTNQKKKKDHYIGK